MMQARKKFSDIFTKIKSCQPRILYPAKRFSKTEDKVNVFQTYKSCRH